MHKIIYCIIIKTLKPMDTAEYRPTAIVDYIKFLLESIFSTHCSKGQPMVLKLFNLLTEQQLSILFRAVD